MFRPTSSKKIVLPLLTLATAAGLIAAAVPASATAPNEIDYTTTGYTTLSNPNSHAKVVFKKSLMRAFITGGSGSTLNLKADLPLAPVTTSFKAFGKTPAKGTVVFTQVAPIDGVVDTSNPNGTGYSLNATGQYVVTLRNVVYDNKAVNVGSNCQSVHPVTVKVSAEPGFDLTKGTLTGNYWLGKFWNCGHLQKTINQTLPGSKNAIVLHIKNAPPKKK